MKNKYKNKLFIFRLFISLPLLSVAFFIIVHKSEAVGVSHLIINEVQITEGAGKTERDFIELYNPTNASVNLKGYRLVKRTKTGTSDATIKSWTSDTYIQSKDYYLWATNSTDNFAESLIADTSTTQTISDDNGIAIRKGAENTGEIIDSVGWGLCSNIFLEGRPALNTSAKKSIERKNFQDTDNNSEDFTILDIPTPTHSQLKEEDDDENNDGDEKLDYTRKIIINELFPSPPSGEKEFVEITNDSGDDIDFDEWCIKDEIKYKKANWDCENPSEVKQTGNFYTLYGSFSLNNDSNGDSAYLYDENKNLIDSVAYEKTKSKYSYSFDSSTWRWTSKLTPGAKNEFDPVLSGKIKKDKDIYVNVYADFEANDVHEKAKKFTWNFGDSHKSYLKKTRHKYERTGKYQASLKITGDGEDSLYSFEVEVKKYPQSKIRIKNVSPNPKGKDTNNEWIAIENKTKKKINLKGWSIATGWKNLYNHPIKKDFIIKKGETKKLTRKICAFTLNNEKTKIELRSPDGKVAQKIKYNRKNNKIEEDEIFEINGKDETWTKPPDETEEQNDTETNRENMPDQMKEEADNSEEEIPGVDIQIDQAELEASLGRYSPDPAWERKQKNKIILANSSVSIKPKIIFTSAEGRVLGAEKIKSSEKYYAFTNTSKERHWAAKSADGFWKKINFGLNWIINQI